MCVEKLGQAVKASLKEEYFTENSVSNELRSCVRACDVVLGGSSITLRTPELKATVRKQVTGFY